MADFDEFCPKQYEAFKIRSCYRVFIKQPDIFLLEVKRITKSRGNEIAEYVKSSNLHQ